LQANFSTPGSEYTAVLYGKIAKLWRIAYLVIFLSLVGCADLASLFTTPTPVSPPQSTATPEPAAPETSTPPASAEPRLLRIWLPPHFDPNADTNVAQLLRQRLAEFQASQRGLRIEVRIKAAEGKQGLLNSLAVTSMAAPAALPDLVALPRVDLESAASTGLLRPMDGLSTLLDDPNWYPFARELGHIQDIGYGLPFAADALVLIHRPDLEINTWQDILASEEPLRFPADNSRLLALLSIYVSAGGKLVNEQGLPTLEEQPLTRTLTLYQEGLETGTFSLSSLELPGNEGFTQEESTGIILNWAVNNWTREQNVMQPVPGQAVSAHVFANGWLWALAGSAPENQQVATELAEFLMEDAFLSEWTRESGYLPTRVTLADGQNAEINAVLEAARVLPSDEVVSTLGPVLSQAVNRVLNGEQVDVVVRSVMEQFQ
jgi:ABC-type glycerol-3-phosphate transport system substrate-binding protein